MDFFQKVGEKAKGLQGKARELGDMAKEVSRKSGEILEVTKIKFELNKLEKEMENNLAGLGAVVYQKFKGAADMDGEIDRLCQSTGRLEEEMKALEKQIEKMQPKTITCPECDVELPTGGKFCSYCGKNVTTDAD
ncbi:MAG: zinc ribbon domain-containing protein [Actinobacteria bacterium]|nr:zinc ribbon domain-containing protein [Actinomycetota bacterium]